jgi:L-ascorbate metabolism protein UlaG (beta-lactamase superfamily)
MIDRIVWLGQASIRIDGKPLIYIDPWEIDGDRVADLILVTHGHFDHCSPEDIRKIRGVATVVAAPGDCAGEIGGDVRSVRPGDRLDLGYVTVEAVPAYNLHKRYHPRDKGWVGYVITLEGTRIYHAGDTDLIPEMSEITADIALLPVGGTYTMDAEEAAEAAKRVRARVAVPMHWGRIVGSRNDADRFRELCSCEVHVLAREGSGNPGE